MFDVKRFRARTTTMPGKVGARVIFPPEAIVEEWDTASGYGRSLIPKRLAAVEPRVGIIQRIVREKGEYIEVICEDEHPRRVLTGAVLSLTGPKVVVEPPALYTLLDFLAGVRLRTDAQRVAVGRQSAAWLRRVFPDLARPLEIPDYGTPAEYVAWLDGFTAVSGKTRIVPGCPIEFDLPPDLNLSERLNVRADDVIERLRRNGSAN